MKCIYCNAEKNLNETHIIPDAMTYYNIKYSNAVCSYEHNTKFSEDFESNIIEKLLPILSRLSIKSSKNKSSGAPDYNIKFTTDDVEFITTYNTFSKVLKGERIIKDVTNNIFLGTKDALSKIEDEHTKIFVDSNKEYDCTTVYDLEVFFSNNIFRLVSKIAYEWFCREYMIKEKVNEFDEVINFIVNGGENKFVTLIYEKDVYLNFNEYSNLGSHSLCLKLDNDRVVVLVSLFGIAIYAVDLGEYDVSKLENKFLYYESTVYYNFTKFKLKNINELLNGISYVAYNTQTGEVFNNEKEDSRYSSKNVVLYLYIMKCYQSLKNKLKISSDDEFKQLFNQRDEKLKEALNTLKDNMIKIDDIRPLNLRSLKDCIKKYKICNFKDCTEYKIDKFDLYLFYYMYLVYDDIDNIRNFEEMCKYISQEDNYIYNIDEITNKMNDILKEKDVNLKLNKVGSVIDKWS